MTGIHYFRRENYFGHSILMVDHDNGVYYNLMSGSEALQFPIRNLDIRKLKNITHSYLLAGLLK